MTLFNLLRSAACTGAMSVVGALAVVPFGCLSFEPYQCSSSEACDLGGITGLCESGWCAYPDAACSGSGYRFDRHAGDGRAGACVDDVASTEPDPTHASDVDSLDDDDGMTQEPDTTTGGPGEDDDDTSPGETDDCGAWGDACCPDDGCGEGLTCNGGLCGCVTGIVAGAHHNCVTKVDGSVWCWGDNAAGQLGVHPEPLAAVPISMGMLRAPNLPAPPMMAWNTTCFLSGDQAVCWGDNRAGQIDPFDLETASLPPAQTGVGAEATLLAVGAAHTCFGRAVAGTVASCIGSNALGQLSDAGPGPGPVDIPAVYEFAQMFASRDHTCGRTAVGDLYCWGSNVAGQLAANPALVTTSPTLRLVELPGVQDIVAGGDHTCARIGADVRCWGANNEGQLGDGTEVARFTPDIDVDLPEGSGIVRMIGAPRHTCVLLEDGELYCWGSNASGQLRLPPDGTGADQLFTSTPVPIDTDGLPVYDAAGGAAHTCIVTTGARVFCWGANERGQIGDGTTAFAFAPTEVDLTCP